MKIPIQDLEPGVLPQSKNFCFASPLLEQECELFYYISWCGYFFCTEKYFHKREYYPYCLLIYVQRGQFHIEYRDYVFDAQAGDVVLMDCTEPHYYSAYNGLEFLYFCFDGANSHDMCQYYLKKEGPLIRSSKNQIIKKMFLDTVAFYDAEGNESVIDASMRIYKFFHVLFSGDDMGIDSSNSDIERILSYIHKNISNKLSVKVLADMAHLSPYYFSHTFKKETGFSPTEYVTNVRVNQAKILLIHSNMSISEIGYSVGYSSSASFANVFTNRIGCSPKQFRKLKGGMHYADTIS